MVHICTKSIKHAEYYANFLCFEYLHRIKFLLNFFLQGRLQAPSGYRLTKLHTQDTFQADTEDDEMIK